MIDPKELHIGSHVMVNGVRARIETIGDAHYIGFSFEEGDESDADPTSDWIQPIPITAELLEELGFKMTNEIGDEYHIAWVREKPWDAYIEYNMNSKLFFVHFGPFNIIRVDYLHEAEYAFYLAYKKELIKE